MVLDFYLNDCNSVYTYSSNVGYIMGNKDGFNPAISSGTQRFEHLGQWATVCYWDYSLLAYSYGDRVFFQNQYGQYWLGMIERDCFVLMC